MSRWVGVVEAAVLVFSLAGCAALQRSPSEVTADQELIQRPAPPEPQPEVKQDQPRSGFEQEPSQAQ
jgi:hypothetical protein